MAGQGEGKTYQYLSRPIEELISGQCAEKNGQVTEPPLSNIQGSGYVDCANPEISVATCDILIIGSGYGGSMAAHTLSGINSKIDHRKLRVIMLERGKEFVPGEFPESLGDLPGDVRYFRDDAISEKSEFTGNADALFDFRINKDVSALIANGLGGGSLINANVALRPDKLTFQQGKWPKELRHVGALEPHFVSAEAMLGVEYPAMAWLPTKYRVFRTLANSVSASAKPAPLTVDLNSCTKCGNCITGCNVGAKKTLPITILADAVTKGLEIYTGASVLTVQRCANDQGWTVRFRRNATAKSILKSEIFQIRARIVIVAAGTLGSTEILLRSKTRAENPLPCSSKVGHGFSTNGDMIAFGYAGASPVRAVGKPSTQKHDDPGPTITGYACTSIFGSPKPPLVIQDAAVPVGLKHIFAELVTTASLAARYVNYRTPEWFKNERKTNPDPIVVNSGAIEHSQIILAMGHDTASGCIQLSKACNVDDSHAVIKWPRAAKDPVFDSIHNKLIEAYAKRGLFSKDRDSTTEGGFDGGDYLPSPAWKPIPDEVAQSIGGGAPEGKVLTVHPLGGCAMADSADQGVVNHFGQVFKNETGTSCYDDLYVLDGAILPGPVGINPFLTIAAIALRNSIEIQRKIKDGVYTFDSSTARVPLNRLPVESYGKPTKDQLNITQLDEKPIKLKLYEQLAAYPAPIPGLEDDYEEFIDKLNEINKKQYLRNLFDRDRYYRLVIKLEAVIENLDSFLEDPDQYRLKGTMSLCLDTSEYVAKGDFKPRATSASDDFGSNPLFITPIVAEHLIPIACGTCEIGLLVRDSPGGVNKLTRWWETAKFAKKYRREDFKLKPFVTRFSELLLTAKQHSYWRQFDYVFTLDEGPLTEKFGRLVFNGKKHLAYSRENPWNALLKLIVDLRFPRKTESRAFYVDLNYLLKDGVPQVIESPHMPATLMGIARFGLFAIRAMAQSYLWSFRALDYDKRSAPQIFPEPVRLGDQTIVNPKVCPIYDIDLDKPPHESKKYLCTVKPYIRLSKYATMFSKEQKHILLIHGLAHGGAIFATSTIEKPMTAYFLEQGYTVWVLDHRLSPALEWRPNRRKVTMDHLAETDVRLAVEHVYREAGCKIDVFAHCVGAGAFAMAVLSGKLHDGKKSKIAKATIHGVTPWLVASPKNRANGKLAAFYKDVLRFNDPADEGFDPIPPYQPQGSDPDFWEALIDRMASAVPKPTSEENGHNVGSFGKAVCNRMALWYGEQWNHKNVDAKTHRRIDELFGFGNLEVFKQLYFCILRQRLTDREGVNAYLTEQYIKEYWLFDTMFIHGADNQVFSVASARESSWKLNETTRLIKEEKDAQKKPYEKPAIWKCELSRYGHLDMILGKGAATHVYPIIHDFFSGKLESKPLKFNDEVTATIDDDPERRSHKGLPPKSPSIGPAIHSPACQNDKVSIQVWLEPTTTSTSPAKYLSYDFHLPPDQFSWYVMDPKPAEDEGESSIGQYGVYWQHKYMGAPPTEPIVASVIYEHEDVPQAGAPPAKNGGPCTYSGASSHYAWLNKIFLKPENRSLSFAAGSCRYPGSPFEREASDAVFSAILAQAKVAPAKSPGALDFALFLGDQIYADATADVFDTHEVAERYWERYRDAFKSKHMKALLNYLPSYFAVDDHEFEDDWLGHETYSPAIHPKSDVYLQARDAARSYLGRTGRLQDHRFWYSFDALNQSFFVMDTRTERNIRRADIPPEKALLTDPNQSEQWSELTGWLLNKRAKNAPLFIASGSPLAPPSSEVLRHKESWRTNDGWLGFPGTLSQFVDFVTKNQIENIVMLGGDLHLSAYAKMIFKGNGREVVIHQIVASGLYAPMPFGNTKIRELGSGTYKIPASNHTIEFGEPQILATAPTHFLRVDLAPTNLITVCTFDHHNKALGKVSFQLR